MAAIQSVQLVGRAAEIATLQAAAAAQAAGVAPVVVVHGEAGIGKTSLVARFADKISANGSTVLWGACFADSGPPYGPWVEAIDGYLEGEDGQGAIELLAGEAAVLGSLAPRIRAVIGDLPAPPALAPAEGQLRLFDAVARLFERLPKPVLVLDDMQWADAGALDLVVHVARLVPGLLIVVIFRGATLDLGDPLAIRLARVSRVRSCTYLLIEGLPREEAADLLERTAGRKLQSGLVQAIYDESDGNPFFLGELGRHIARVGDRAIRSGDRWRLPETIRGAVGLRLAGLSAAARVLLELAAVFTGGFDFEELRALTGMDEAELLDGVEEALHAELLRSLDGERYAFAHALVRQALYERLSPSRRARLHRRLATALEQLYKDPPGGVAAEIARQYRASITLPGAERGVARAVSGADHARKMQAPAEAVELLRLALELVPDRDDALRGRILGSLSLAEAEAAMPARAITTLESAIALLEREGMAGRDVAELTCDVARAVWIVVANPPGTAGILARALGVLGDEHSLLWARLKILLTQLAEPVRTGPITIEPVVPPDPLALSIVLDQGNELDIATTLGPAGRWSQGLDWAVSEISRWHDPAARTTALFWIVARLTVLEPGSPDLAEELCHQLDSLADQVGAIAHRAAVPRFRSALHAARGSLDSATEQLAEARRRSERLAEMEQFGLYHEVLIAQHRDSAWWRRGEELWHAATLPSNTTTSPLFGALACYAFAQGELTSKARQLLEEIMIPALRAASPWDQLVVPAVAYTAGAIWELRDEDLARELLPAAEAIVAAGVPDWYMSSTELTVARLATVLDRYEDAAAAFRRARERLARAPQLPMRAIVDYDDALARRWLGMAGSEPLLLAAETQFAQLGMTAWSERAMVLRRSRGGLPDGLTRREAEVLRLVAAGMSNRQIAEQLVLSVHTVERHVQNAYAKIGARNRADAAAYTVRHAV